MSVLFTFPGQGSQRAGMLHALPVHAEVARTLRRSQRHARLRRPRPSTTPLRCAPPSRCSFACWSRASLRRAWMSAHGYEPDMVAGLSIGAYPAAVIAGALPYADASGSSRCAAS